MSLVIRFIDFHKDDPECISWCGLNIDGYGEMNQVQTVILLGLVSLLTDISSEMVYPLLSLT